MSKELKQIRGQIRQIVKDILPEVITSELVAALEKVLVARMDEGLKRIDVRQADLQSYIVRNAGVPVVKE